MTLSNYIDSLPYTQILGSFISTGWIPYKPENEQLFINECKKRNNMSICTYTKKFRLFHENN